MTSSPLCLFTVSIIIMANICTAQIYVAEGYFVIDESAVKNYITAMNTTDSNAVKYQKALDSIQKDVNYVITQVNYILTSVSKYGYNINVAIRRIDILSTNIATSFWPGTSNVVESFVALDSFQNWLIQQNLYETLQYDFALYWTGLDLFGAVGQQKTYDSVVGGICAGPAAVAVAEFQPTYRDVVGTAHAISLLLGSSTDGVTSNYISAFMNSPSHPNRWSFSPCSAGSMKEFLQQLKPNCLLTSNPLTVKPAVTYSTYTGDLFDPDVICQRSLNDTTSYMCKSLPQVYNYLPPRGNAVCSQIYCHVTASMLCTPVYTSDGMICDNQKRCTGGACVTDKTPYLNSNCLWGDQKILELAGFTGSCQQYISQYGAISCYNTPINESCCATCKSYSTGISGCEYGDKSADCVKTPRDQICPKNRTLCCAYCNGYYIGKRSVQEHPVPALNITLPLHYNQVNKVQSYEDYAKHPHHP